MSAPHRIFADNALELRAYGLAVLPCRGKAPRIEHWSRWKRPPSPRAVEQFARQHPDADIGFLPGLSRRPLLIADVDDPDHEREVERLLGPTPFRVVKGRGPHRYYRDPGCAWLPSNLAALGLKVDLKAGKSIVIAPPSRHHSGGTYKLDGCRWRDLERLPLPNLDRLQELLRSKPEANAKAGMRDGSRKQWLNDRLCAHVSFCDGSDDLLDKGRTLNEEIPRQFPGATPLPDEIVVQRVMAVWKQRDRFDMWFGRKAVAFTRAAELKQLCSMSRKGSDAHTLLMLLRAEHGARCRRGNTFALVTEAMQRMQVIPGWDWRRYTAAIKLLLDAGFIVQVAPPMWATRGRRPAQYLLAAAAGLGPGERGRGGGQLHYLPNREVGSGGAS
jgi:hypothetical protein